VIILILKIFIVLSLASLLITCFFIFFDQALLTRKGTIYRVKRAGKKVALTFDDGPSPIWTPQILLELKKTGIKATFFMIGHHVEKYPEVARQVALEGHLIANHGFAHSVIVYYTPNELEADIKYTEIVIREVTGQTTKYFRPPKAMLGIKEKLKIKGLGYEVVLWSLNSKDWVTFDHHHIVRYLLRHIRNGDILLFHDSGGVVEPEGGNRQETVAAIPLLVKELKERGYEFVTIEELLHGS